MTKSDQAALAALSAQWRSRGLVAGQYSVECQIEESSEAYSQALTLEICVDDLDALCRRLQYHEDHKDHEDPLSRLQSDATIRDDRIHADPSIGDK